MLRYVINKLKSSLPPGKLTMIIPRSGYAHLPKSSSAKFLFIIFIYVLFSGCHSDHCVAVALFLQFLFSPEISESMFILFTFFFIFVYFILHLLLDDCHVIFYIFTKLYINSAIICCII